MKKTKSDELRPEYRCEDLGPGVSGKYFESYRKGKIPIPSHNDLREKTPHMRRDTEKLVREDRDER